MSVFESYDEYCRGFQEPDLSDNAQLEFFLRSWLSKIADNMISYEYDGGYFGTDDFVFPDAENTGKDILSVITEYSADAFMNISVNMRSKILHENSLVPVYMAREINSAGMSWLSRLNGKNLKEKLSAAGSVMAVTRRQSFDTGENRLFVDFLKRLNDFIRLKNSFLPENLHREQEENLSEKLTAFLFNESVQEIKRYENVPPNNTLLSDKNYRKIWEAWNMLNSMDSMIKYDCDHIDDIVCTVVFWKIFSMLCNRFLFPQTPVIFDYEKFIVRPAVDAIKGTSSSGDMIHMKLNKNNIQICYETEIYNIRVEKSILEFFCGRKNVFSVVINKDNIISSSMRIASKFKKNSIIKIKCQENIRSQNIYIDLFSVQPYYILDDGLHGILEMLAAVAEIKGNDEQVYVLNIDKSYIADISNIQKIISVHNYDKADDITRILYIISKYVSAAQFNFLFPDIYDEFRLSSFRKAARSFYYSVSTLPKSIAAVFGAEIEGRIDNMSPHDIYIVADIVDGELTVTTVLPTLFHDHDEKRLVLERYPTYSKKFEYKKGISVITEMLGDELTTKHIRNLVFFDKDGRLNDLGGIESQMEFDGSLADNIINSYISDHRKLFDKKEIHILYLSDMAECYSYHSEYISSEIYIKGFYECVKRTERKKYTLWQDHLPNLSINRLFGEFSLVKNQTIIPQLNEVKKIIIENTFTLPANRKKYCLDLIQNETNRIVQYQALIESPAFPVSHDIECRLSMSYKYGDDEPYTLIFKPVDSDSAGFFQIKAKWIQRQGYPSDDLIYPVFPEASPVEMMYNYPKKKSTETSNLFDWIEKVLAVPKPKYERETDISDFSQKIDRKGNQYLFLLDELEDDDGKLYDLRIFSWDFIKKDELFSGFTKIYFDAFKTEDRYGNSQYKAVRICTDQKTYVESYYKYPKNAKRLASVLFAVHTITANGRSLNTKGYPEKTRKAVSDSLRFYERNLSIFDKETQRNIITIMSLFHDEMGDTFYEMLCGMVDRYIADSNKYKLTEKIGYALGDFTSLNEKNLFYKLLELEKVNTRKLICIFSLAAWKNPDFIFNMQSNFVLYFFESAADIIYHYSIDHSVEKPFDVMLLMEYCLAVFRLRQLDDKHIRYRLSRNSESVRTLILSLENIVYRYKNFLPFFERSRIKLEIKKKSRNDIPELIYALMLYAYGEANADEIRISGIDDDSSDNGES